MNLAGTSEKNIRVMIYNIKDMKNLEPSEIVCTININTLEKLKNETSKTCQIFFMNETPCDFYHDFGLTQEEIFHYQKNHILNHTYKENFIVGRSYHYEGFQMNIPDHHFFKTSVYNFYYQELAKYIIRKRG